MKLIADTYEENDRTPVVRHVFYGKTERRARAIYAVLARWGEGCPC